MPNTLGLLTTSNGKPQPTKAFWPNESENCCKKGAIKPYTRRARIADTLEVLAALALSALAALPQRPEHISTADYWGGYAGTHSVEPQVAAGWLTWASVN